MVSQSERIAQRVNLIFAFVQLGLHVCEVACPRVVLQRTRIECVGIRVDVDALELAQDHTAQHLLQLRVFVCQLHIGPHLRSGVAEPHGSDVAGVNESVVLAVEVHSGVDSVREAVLKHPCQIFVILQELLHFLYFLLLSIRA